MKKILITSLLLLLVDKLSIKIAKKIDNSIDIKNNPNIRWFFIHSISNTFITYYSIPDLITCLQDPYNIYKHNWNENSYNSFIISMLTHLYHIIFFKLTNNDKIHHLLMVIISGSIEYYTKNIITSAGLFFVTGLPGAIDYFLLYLVKLNKISKKSEKIIYIYLSAFIRSPGTCVVSVISLYNIKYYFNNNYIHGIMSLISALLLYWNGQYYSMISSIDYGKFIQK